MSWFDTTGFATLAKSALKEAQKTIDKALDIQEDEVKGKTSTVETPSSGSDVSFFSAWGLEGSSSQSSPGTVLPKDVPDGKLPNSSSLWGSFTGSFFEPPGKPDDHLVANQPKKSIPPRSLSLDIVPSPTPDSPNSIKEEILNYPNVEVIMRKHEPKAVNRLSVISSESDRRSSDSCDVLGSTPDSDPSISNSSSNPKLRQSGSFGSVEVLTSPSSVDILPADTITDPKHSSDSISPIAESDGVEPLREDEDEVSVEDSYTSASETTLTLTVLDHNNLMLKSTSSLDTSFSEAMSPRESRHGLHSETEVVTQPPRKDKLSTSFPGLAQPHHDVVTEAPKLSVPSPRVSECLSDQEVAQAETSSCDEGTIMGSSDEGANLSRVSRSQVTHMIAEAMDEPSSSLIREQSPISERSDLIKIGSSEHTSGDEIETATSSDIEIISSPTPNGSSTASRQSPTKPINCRTANLGKILGSKVKGHHREPSETSSGGSDECSEVDKLLKRLAEMTEILEARESKLIDLSRINVELNESVSDLKHQLERQNEAQDLKNMSEEFTHRLAALEKKFQQAIREKEQLRMQLENAQSVAAERELDQDKDQVIAELRAEGEKLSKQQLVLNNTIKKLRAAEKENTKAIATLRDQLANTTQELERSKKAMSAKEEMERSHIEAVHNLTKQVANLEKELTTAKSNVASLTSTLISTQREMEEKEEKHKKTGEQLQVEKNEVEERLRDELRAELEGSQQQVVMLQSAVEDIRRQMNTAQQQFSKQEASLRREVFEMRLRAEAAERKLEKAQEAARLASQPLASQLQAQAVAHEQAIAQWEKQETALNSTIRDLESKVSLLNSSERNVRELHESSSARIAALESKISGLTQQNESLISELNSNRESLDKLKVLKNSEIKKYQIEKDRLISELDEKKRELVSLKEVLSVERAALDAEKRKNNALTEQLRVSNSIKRESPSPPPSPTLSLGASMTDSVSSTVWPHFGEEDAGRFFDILRPSNNSSYIETLQSQLKLREGEIHQLQWELSRLEAERSSLRDEVSSLLSQTQTQSEDVASLALIKTQYDALLQMYGEKVEECQELRMDLDDMKDVYKTQIEELLKGKSEPAATSSSHS